MPVSHGEGDGVLPQPPVYAERDALRARVEGQNDLVKSGATFCLTSIIIHELIKGKTVTITITDNKDKNAAGNREDATKERADQNAAKAADDPNGDAAGGGGV